MTLSFTSLRRLRRVPVATATLIALWCAAGSAAAGESGTVELVTSFVRDYVTFDHAGGTVTGGILRGTTTVTGSSGDPFAEGESNLVVCLVYAKKTDAGMDLETPCTNTDTSGDTWFWIARRTAGDTEAGGGGEGQRELVGGTGKYVGVSGACTYSARYLADNRSVSVASCEWRKP